MSEAVQDVVVIVPGILGSTLKRHGKPIWGTARSMAKALLMPNSVLGLRGTDGATAEPGVKATSLIGRPGQFPSLAKIDVYRPLLKQMRDHLALDHDNLVVFAYDWRLSNVYNAGELWERVEPVLRNRRRTYPDAKLVFVCHSMGGLLVQQFTDVLDHGADTRRVISFGTPFRGAAKALGVLAHGWPTNLPVIRRRFKDLAHTLPSVHELLPRYRVVAAHNLRRQLTSDDLDGIVHPGHLARANQLHAQTDVPGPRPYRRTVVAGAFQPTPQFVTIADGRVRLLNQWQGLDGDVVDRRGDGTVPRQSISPPEWDDDADAIPHTQSHLALPNTASASGVIYQALTTGPRADQAPKARAQLALDAPDLTEAGKPLVIRVSASDGDLPLHVRLADIAGRPLGLPQSPDIEDGLSVVRYDNLAPGTYRVRLEPGVRAPDVAPIFDVTTIVDASDLPDDEPRPR